MIWEAQYGDDGDSWLLDDADAPECPTCGHVAACDCACCCADDAAELDARKGSAP